MDLRIVIGVLCCVTAAIAKPSNLTNGYFNSTAYALKVYGHSFYNPITGVALQGVIDEDTTRFPSISPKISFRDLPCDCVDGVCGCCAGLNISAISFDQRYCANFTFDLSNLTIDLKVLMNENEIYKNSLSARNPPPVCMPATYVPMLNFCMRFYDLSLPGGNNLRTCIDFEVRLIPSPLTQSLLTLTSLSSITLSPILVMHFNCIRVGADGIVWTNPGDEVAAAAAASAGPQPMLMMQEAIDVFDPVNFEPADPLPNDGFALNATTLSPEDEDKIGSHRIP